MFGVGWHETKIFIVAFLILLVIPLVFIPISVWQEAFWRYLNETAPIMWLGQVGWIIFLAASVTFFMIFLERVFFD